MKRLPSGALQVEDGEKITLDIKSTGAETLFGVVYSFAGKGASIPQGAPFPITMKWADATGTSTILGAKSGVLILTFNFSSKKDGRYDYTMTGAPGGDPPLKKRATQAGQLPTVNNFTFHILPPPA
jgi:hypothetical protein